MKFLFIVLAGLGMAAVGCRGFNVREETVEMPDLPPCLEGFRIAHLSDLHMKEKDDLHSKVIDKIAQLEPDFVVITGDFVETPDKIELCIDFVRRIRAKHGIWAVLGNWDWWTGQKETLVQQLRAVGVCVLINESVRIAVDGTSLYIVGVDDPYTGHDDLDQALATLPESARAGSADAFVLLLAHSPQIFESAKAQHIVLTLCGHTHGGQVRLPLCGPVYVENAVMRRYSMGLYEEQGSWLNVNPGIGWSVTRCRLFCPPELTVVTLRRK